MTGAKIIAGLRDAAAGNLERVTIDGRTWVREPKRTRGSRKKIIMDVWGGYHSQEHVARFVRSVDDCLELARVELASGYLINLRQDAAWGDYTESDERVPGKGIYGARRSS